MAHDASARLQTVWRHVLQRRPRCLQHSGRGGIPGASGAVEPRAAESGPGATAAWAAIVRRAQGLGAPGIDSLQIGRAWKCTAGLDRDEPQPALRRLRHRRPTCHQRRGPDDHRQPGPSPPRFRCAGTQQERGTERPGDLAGCQGTRWSAGTPSIFPTGTVLPAPMVTSTDGEHPIAIRNRTGQRLRSQALFPAPRRRTSSRRWTQAGEPNPAEFDRSDD